MINLKKRERKKTPKKNIFFYGRQKYENIIPLMPPDLMLKLIYSGLNYPYLKTETTCNGLKGI